MGRADAVINVQCFRCKHRIPIYDDNPRCAAFPAGIPQPVLLGAHDHRTAFPGDGGIHFERDDDWLVNLAPKGDPGTSTSP